MGARPAIFFAAVCALGTAALPVARALIHENPTALAGFGCVPGVVCFAAENRTLLPSDPYVFRTGGYDGQFFYYIARDLYGAGPAVVDDRPLRYARIGLPLLAGWPGIFGPGAALFGLILIPWLVHVGTATLAARRFGFFPGLLWALNPFSVLSSLLTVADGFALSLGTLAFFFSLDTAAGPERGRRTAGILAFLFFSASLLCKETMLAQLLGTAFAAGLISVTLRFRPDKDSGSGKPAVSRYARLSVIPVAACFPVLAWWRKVDFSFLHAGQHGGFPLAGMLEFLEGDPGSLGRTILVLYFGLCLIAGALLIGSSALSLAGGPPWRRNEVFGDMTAGTALLLTAGLTAFATGEYWHNFANIARMFTPSVLGLTWASARFRPLRWATAGFFGGLLFVIARTEITAKVLPSVNF